MRRLLHSLRGSMRHHPETSHDTTNNNWPGRSMRPAGVRVDYLPEFTRPSIVPRLPWLSFRSHAFDLWRPVLALGTAAVSVGVSCAGSRSRLVALLSAHEYCDKHHVRLQPASICRQVRLKPDYFSVVVVTANNPGTIRHSGHQGETTR